MWRGVYRALFDSQGRVTHLSLEGDVSKQAGLTVSFGGFGCRRAGDIALPSFIASMNSVGELVETILSIINIADTNELAEAVESWREASGGAILCLMTHDVRRPGTFLLSMTLSVQVVLADEVTSSKMRLFRMAFSGF